MEDGTELPISEELRNTVHKLRSLVETELGVGMHIFGKTVKPIIMSVCSDISDNLKDRQLKEMEFEYENQIEVTYHFIRKTIFHSSRQNSCNFFCRTWNIEIFL